MLCAVLLCLQKLNLLRANKRSRTLSAAAKKLEARLKRRTLGTNVMSLFAECKLDVKFDACISSNGSTFQFYSTAEVE